MKLIIIAAVSSDGVIGIDDNIPWRIPEDFKHFRDTTMGNVLLVGATTFQTLPQKAHEGREFIVLNSGERFELPEAKYYQFSDFDVVLDLLHHPNVSLDKVYVIGGSSIYHLMIDYCDEAIITWVNTKFDDLKGAVMFPIDKLFTNFDPYAEQEWQKSTSGLEYKITKYQRKDGCPKKITN